MKETRNNKQETGFTLLIAIVITSTLLLVSAGIVNVAVKEAFLSAAARESQHAFYAADTGIECALFWDVRGGAFSTTTGSTISCNGQDSSVGNGSVSTFQFDFAPQPYCALVTVAKGATTRIESRGYNTCDTTSSRRVERGVVVGY